MSTGTPDTDWVARRVIVENDQHPVRRGHGGGDSRGTYRHLGREICEKINFTYQGRLPVDPIGRVREDSQEDLIRASWARILGPARSTIVVRRRSTQLTPDLVARLHGLLVEPWPVGSRNVGFQLG